MAFYFVCLICCLLSFFVELNKKSKNFIVFLLIIILVSFAGTRMDIDNDYSMYYELFSMRDHSIKDFLNRIVSVEWCIFIIPRFWVNFFDSNKDIAYASFVTFAFLGVITKMIAIKRISKFFFLSTLLYVSNLFIMQEMTTIRAGVASGIFLLSIKDLEFNKNKNALVKYSLSFIFHTSSVLFVLTWIILKAKLKIRYYYYAVFIAFMMALFKINILKALFLDRIFSRVEIYIKAMEVYGDKGGTNIFNFRIIFAVLVLIIFAINYKKLKKHAYFDILFRIHIISLVVFFALSSSSEVFSIRSFELLSIIQVLLYPFLVITFRAKAIGWSIIILYSIIQIYYYIDVVDIYKPYQSWFF